MGAVGSVIFSSEISVPMERRIEYLKSTPFFILLTEEQIAEFAKCFPSAFKANQGSKLKLENGIIYVVAEGELELSTTLPLTRKHKVDSNAYLCKKSKGDVVNQQQTKIEAERRVSQRKLKKFVDDIKTFSCTKSLVLRCDPTLLSEFQSQNPELSAKVEAIITANIAQSLTHLTFLKDVKETQLHILAAMCRYEAFDSGKVVFEEHSCGSKLYILLDGMVGVYVNNNDGTSGVGSSSSSSSLSASPSESAALQRSLEGTVNPSSYNIDDKKGQRQTDNKSDNSNNETTVQIASFGKNDYFGETSLLVNIPRTTSVITKTKTLFVTVTKMDFENFLKVCPIKDIMMNVMKERMLAKLASIGIPFLVGIPEQKLSSLSRTAEILEIEEGDVVFCEGDVGDRFYIVVHGAVKVETSTSSSRKGERDDEKANATDKNIIEVGRLGPGKYFGETALVTDTPRSATIKALGKLVLLSVDKNSFHNIFDENSQLLAEFELRVLKANSELIHVLRSDGGTVAFREFLQKGHAEENLDFWLDVKNFRVKDWGDEVREEAAKRIYDTFCDEAAERQVNIPDQIRKELKTRINAGKIDANLFDDAQAEIFKMMNRDNYARFKMSEGFKNFFAHFGVSL